MVVVYRQCTGNYDGEYLRLYCCGAVDRGRRCRRGVFMFNICYEGVTDERKLGLAVVYYLWYYLRQIGFNILTIPLNEDLLTIRFEYCIWFVIFFSFV